jgi:hypothetical protein
LGILNEFERRLEGAIEGIFTKAFRTGVHPVELATRILKELEAGKTVGVHQVWVPNHFTFRLSPVDRERFEKTERALRRELEQVVRDGAKERGWDLVGPAEVGFETDPSLKQGKFDCEAALVEGATGTSPPQRSEAPAPAPPPKPASAELVFIVDGKPGKRHPIAGDLTRLGRLADSDVVLADPGASRRHAEIRREDGRFVIADLGSTNGTLVNESAVTERPLEDGDRITIGRTVIEFRSR